MTHPAHRIAAAAVALCLAASASLAHARAPSTSEAALAKDLASEAFAEQKAGRFADAIEMLKQVIAIKPSAEALLHLGQCLAATGALREAQTVLEQAEDAARDGRDRQVQTALLTVLSDVRARLPTVKIDVPTNLGSLAVTVDGESVSSERLSRPLPLDPGAHVIVATVAGRPRFERKLALAERDVVVVSVAFTSDAALVPASSRSRVPLATWVASGAALTLAAGGVVSFVVAGNVADDGAKTCATQPVCDESSQTTVRSLDAAALGLWVGAGVFAAVGVTLWLVEEGPVEVRASGAWPRSVALSVLPGATTLTLAY